MRKIVWIIIMLVMVSCKFNDAQIPVLENTPDEEVGNQETQDRITVSSQTPILVSTELPTLTQTEPQIETQVSNTTEMPLEGLSFAETDFISSQISGKIILIDKEMIGEYRPLYLFQDDKLEVIYDNALKSIQSENDIFVYDHETIIFPKYYFQSDQQLEKVTIVMLNIEDGTLEEFFISNKIGLGINILLIEGEKIYYLYNQKLYSLHFFQKTIIEIEYEKVYEDRFLDSFSMNPFNSSQYIESYINTPYFFFHDLENGNSFIIEGKAGFGVQWISSGTEIIAPMLAYDKDEKSIGWDFFRISKNEMNIPESHQLTYLSERYPESYIDSFEVSPNNTLIAFWGVTNMEEKDKSNLFLFNIITGELFDLCVEYSSELKSPQPEWIDNDSFIIEFNQSGNNEHEDSWVEYFNIIDKSRSTIISGYDYGGIIFEK